MTARKHHYVPRWLQYRFLEGASHFHYLDLTPDRVRRPDGGSYTRRDLLRWGPSQCFAATDLYTARFPGKPLDVVEKKFFGLMDDRAAKAVDYFVFDKFAPKNEQYTHFLQYMSAQKMRTPKGLDWLRPFAEYAFGVPFDTSETLMPVLQDISEMHITTWAESVWEVISAEATGVGFLLTDHPITAYNVRAFPGSRLCRYPLEPVIELLGTRTIFPLGSRHCLILSNQEYFLTPVPERALKVRTNARAFGFSMFSPMHIQRGRTLNTEQVLQINFILKKRARRYIAALERDWLFPENYLKQNHWSRFDRTLQPVGPTLIREIWAEYEDGTEIAMDSFGRPIIDAKRWEEMQQFKEQIGKK